MPKDTRLHKAAVEGNINSLKDCLEVDDIDVNCPGANGRTALHRAAGKNRADVVFFLLDKVRSPLNSDSRLQAFFGAMLRSRVVGCHTFTPRHQNA
eukprot:scaffold1659_cov255-Pinguiococcus_pyrenoidosus.AAC.52